jgi:LacI family transcriptional regulator
MALQYAGNMSRSNPQHGSVTLLDVAQRAGVSRATASLVLRESPLVARSTRERVHAAVAELGYVYNRRAASLRASRTKTVGLIVCELTNPFFAELTVGVDAALDAGGYVAFVANTAESIERQQRFLQRMREQNVDGVVVCPAAGTRLDVLHQLQQWRMPCVQTLRFLSEREGDYAGSDYELGLEQVTEHLVRLGHRRIAFLTGDKQHSATRERRAGFTNAMRRHRLDDGLVLEIPLTRRAGAEAVEILLNRIDRPTAAICYNDVVALGMLMGLHARGLTPGKDLAVTGVDDIPEAAMSLPGLTTVSTSPREVGKVAAELLLRRIADPQGSPERVVLPTRLIVRQSCGATSQTARRELSAFNG